MTLKKLLTLLLACMLACNTVHAAAHAEPKEATRQVRPLQRAQARRLYTPQFPAARSKRAHEANRRNFIMDRSNHGIITAPIREETAADVYLEESDHDSDSTRSTNSGHSSHASSSGSDSQTLSTEEVHPASPASEEEIFNQYGMYDSARVSPQFTADDFIAIAPEHDATKYFDHRGLNYETMNQRYTTPPASWNDEALQHKLYDNFFSDLTSINPEKYKNADGTFNHDAFQAAQQPIVNIVLNPDFNPNWISSDAAVVQTSPLPLVLAVRYKCYAVIEALIQHGALPNLFLDHGTNAIGAALEIADFEALSLLRMATHGFLPPYIARLQKTPLHAVALLKIDTITKTLLPFYPSYEAAQAAATSAIERITGTVIMYHDPIDAITLREGVWPSPLVLAIYAKNYAYLNWVYGLAPEQFMQAIQLPYNAEAYGHLAPNDPKGNWVNEAILEEYRELVRTQQSTAATELAE
jgi:hypothetical protein